MNAYDSGRMADVMAPHGYGLVDDAADADLIVLNTCHIREKAAEKTFSELGRLRQLKELRAARGQRLLLAVAGCVAQAEGAELQARAPYVDIVLGPQTYHRLPELVARVERQAGGVIDTEFPPESKFDHLPCGTGASGASAFLSVQEGCDKFCTFCVVPYTRGAEFSRPPENVLAEARALLRRGAVELTLLGQNVNAYHGLASDGRVWSLARLIDALCALPALKRLRYTTSHPLDMADDLIARHRDCEKLMPYLHLPVQAGSDRVLLAMNRRYRRADYERVVERLRLARPDLALSGDFIVGFPGESEADFAETLALVRQVGYAQAYSFMYSGRPGTPAAALPGQVPEAVKAERLGVLQALLGEQQRRFNEASVGRVLPVLFVGAGRRPGQTIGRSPHNQSVHVVATCPPGSILDVAIAACHGNSLTGRLAA